jgi:23S rRNA pseudouridine955/2504/2580 synthase
VAEYVFGGPAPRKNPGGACPIFVRTEGQDGTILAQNQAPVRYVRITERDAGQRIDNFLLRTLKGVPRSHVYRLLRSGQVRVNKGRAKPDRRLELGDELRLPPVSAPDPGRPRRAPDDLVERVAGSVIHEDADFVVLNKPAGLPVHGGSGVAYGLIEVLRQSRPCEPMLELAHRLDRDTSGCLVVARTRPALVAIHDALRGGEAEKIYQALLVGRWRGGPREANDALIPNKVKSGERVVMASEEGRAARSLFSPDKKLRVGGTEVSLMRVQIFTGRTHQIRVHAAQLGHPVAGDEKYGSREVNRIFRNHGLPRMFLHAASMRVRLSGLNRTLDCRAPLADDLRDFLDNLTPAHD